MLILDEPLANLDTITAERIEDLLLSIENKTILIVSHQFSQAKLDAFDKYAFLGRILDDFIHFNHIIQNF